MRAYLISFLLLSNFTLAAAAEIPDIRDLPRLSASLPKGTIAWATVDQLHPLQPQTGKREVDRKEAKLEDLLRYNFEKFSSDLYEFLYTDSLVPVFIGKTPRSDSRYGREKILGYVTDRTHGTNAMADMIEYYYGKRALRDPIYDAKGRPLNVVIVRVDSNLSGYSPERFAQNMKNKNRGYFKKWSRARDGSTVIKDIDFSELPEKVYQTTDNPYRSVVSSLQKQKEIARRKVDFYQFKDAEKIKRADIIEWDDISADASGKSYKKAVRRCADLFSEE